MKNMIFSAFALIFLVSSCCTNQAKPISPMAATSADMSIEANDPANHDELMVEFYYTLGGVDDYSRATIKAAINHMQEEIWCLFLTEIDYAESQKIKKNMILHFISVRVLPNHTVGLKNELNKEKLLFISKYGKDDNYELRELGLDYMFKVALHEMAHGMGMDSHAFNQLDMEKSHLSPVISGSSNKLLSEKDIEYLEEMICEDRSFED